MPKDEPPSPDLEPCLKAYRDALNSRDAVKWWEFTQSLKETQISGAILDTTLACMFALPRIAKQEVLEALVYAAAGPPQPSFGEIMRDAEDWAGYAGVRERKAYAAAIYRRMTPDERARFYVWARGVDLQEIEA